MMLRVQAPVLEPDAGLRERARVAIALVKEGRVVGEDEALDLLAAVVWPDERFVSPICDEPSEERRSAA